MEVEYDESGWQGRAKGQSNPEVCGTAAWRAIPASLIR